MKVCITGITGRIGSALARRLVEQGHEVRGLVMPGDPLLENARSAGADICIGSVLDIGALEGAVEGAQVIVHLAAIMSYRPEDHAALYEVNVRGTYNLLEAIDRRAERPAHIVFASTDATYPSTAPLYRPVDENHPQRPASVYGLTKLIGEEMVRFYGERTGFTYTITRFSHTETAVEVIEPQGVFAQRLFFVNGRLRVLNAQGNRSPQVRETIAILEKLAARDEPLLIPYDAEGRAHEIEVTDARDIAQGLALVLERPEARDQVFNLGPATSYSLAEVIPYMARATGRRYVEARLPLPATIVQTSNARARMLLGYQPRYSLYDMIDEAVEVVRSAR